MFTHKINEQKYSKHLIYIDLQFAKYEIYELADVDFKEERGEKCSD